MFKDAQLDNAAGGSPLKLYITEPPLPFELFDRVVLGVDGLKEAKWLLYKNCSNDNFLTYSLKTIFRIVLIMLNECYSILKALIKSKTSMVW